MHNHLLVKTQKHGLEIHFLRQKNSTHQVFKQIFEFKIKFYSFVLKTIPNYGFFASCLLPYQRLSSILYIQGVSKNSRPTLNLIF